MQTQKPYVEVKLGRVVDVVVDNLDRDGITQEGQKLLELGSTDTVSAIQDQRRQLGLSIDKGFEGTSQLLVVALSAGLTISLGSTSGVEAASDVVELGGGQDAVIGRLCVQNLETVEEGVDKRLSTRAGVASKDDVGGLGEVDLQGADHGANVIDQLLVRLGVGQGGRMSLPGTLEHLSHGIHQLDTIILIMIENVKQQCSVAFVPSSTYTTPAVLAVNTG